MSNNGNIEERLRRADWLTRPETQRILALLDGVAGRTRVVGGIVRDTLLELPHDGTDLDIATELVPDEVTRRARHAGLAVYPTGIEHGTVTLRLDALTAEVTTLREDIETDGRRAVVRFGNDWGADAMRRDFTLNALYAGMDGTLFDPLHGLDDLLARRVRFIGSPEARIAEDRLRVFRFFRFSASHGNEQLDPAGLHACAAAAGTLGGLAAERIGAEMRRMLALPSVAKTLQAMEGAGILEFGRITLELLKRYERRATRPGLHARLALVGAEEGLERLQAMWRLSNEDVAKASAVLAGGQLLAEMRLNEAAYRYPMALADALGVAAALANWGDDARLGVVERVQRINVPRFPIGGKELLSLGVRPGPGLGAELARLERAWIESGFTLDRQALREMVSNGGAR